MRMGSAAVPPSSPTSPRPLRDAVFAALLGLLLGVGIALVRDALDRTVTDPHEMESTLGFPLLGYVRSDILGTAPVYAERDDRRGRASRFLQDPAGELAVPRRGSSPGHPRRHQPSPRRGQVNGCHPGTHT